MAVVAVVWGWMLDYQFGVVNYLAERAGLAHDPIGFPTDPDLALWSVGAAQVWRLLPLAMVMAALKTIPAELHEAAAMDGATWLQAFRHITLPRIAGAKETLMVLLAIWAFGQMMPPVLLFVLVQRAFVANLAAGGAKG